MRLVVALLIGAVACSRGGDKPARPPADAAAAPVTPRDEALASFRAWLAANLTEEPRMLATPGDPFAKERPFRCSILGTRMEESPPGTFIGVVQVGTMNLPLTGAYRRSADGRDWTCDPEVGMCQVDQQCNRKSTEVPAPPRPVLWTYGEQPDKMRGTVGHHATLLSTSACPVTYPVPGNARLFMVVRELDKKTHVFLQARDGNLDLCLMGCKVDVKFDDDAVATYAASGSQNLQSATVFIDKHARWLARLQRSKSAIVEVTMLSGGKCQFEFETSGLEWPR